MSFAYNLGRNIGQGVGNFAKNLGKANQDLGHAARVVGGGAARLGYGLGKWALTPRSAKEGNISNGVTQGLSNFITNGLQNWKPTAGIGRHFAGHNLFMHDAGDGYGIFEPGEGGEENGSKGRGYSGVKSPFNRGQRNNGQNGQSPYGNIYHFHGNNYIHNGNVNNGNINNVINHGNIGNVGGTGGVGNINNNFSPIVKHLQNAYVDRHIDNYETPKLPKSPIPLAKPTTPQTALNPGKATTAAANPSPALVGKPLIDASSAVVGKPGINPNSAIVSRPRIEKPDETMPYFNQKPVSKKPVDNKFTFNHVTNPTSGEDAMNTTQANLLSRKASQMLSYINDVYAFEPENVRMALALEAAVNFYKNAAEDGMMPTMDASVDAPMPVPKPSRQDNTMNPDDLFSKVHPDVIKQHTDKAMATNPNFTGFGDAIHGRFAGSDGSEFKGKRFTLPKSTHDRLPKDPKKYESAVSSLFHDWAENHAHPTFSQLASGVSGDALNANKAKEKKQRSFERGQQSGGTSVGDVVQKSVDSMNTRHRDFSDDEPLPGMTGNDVPMRKQKEINDLRNLINTPGERYKVDPNSEEPIMPRSEEQMRELLDNYDQKTSHLSQEEKLKGLHPAYHGIFSDIQKQNKARDLARSGVTPNEKAKGEELKRRQQEFQRAKEEGRPAPTFSDSLGEDDKSSSDIENRVRRDMEKGDFRPGNRNDAPIENTVDTPYGEAPELLNDKDYGDARQMSRNEKLQDMGLGEDASRDEDLKNRLRERVNKIKPENLRGNVDLDRGGKGVAPVTQKRNPDEKKDNDIGAAKEISRRDENRRLNQENERDNSPLARSKSKNTGESGKSRKKHEGSKLDELRIITAGMNSYEIEAIADGLINLGFNVDQIVQVASDCEDINGSTSAVLSAAGDYWKPVPEHIKKGLH